jgi:aerotaxis receptor
MSALQAKGEQEKIVPDNVFIYSTTDLEGRITSVNEAFIEISGYSAPELIGQPHSIVRHPDMPPAAFADLWRDLKAGQPWQGVVKNRCKDGRYYWVEANVSPIRESGRIVGYGSVRRRPARATVGGAEAVYRQLRSRPDSLVIEHGRAVSRGLGPTLLRMLHGVGMNGLLVISLSGLLVALAGLTLGWGSIVAAGQGVALLAVLGLLFGVVPRLHRAFHHLRLGIERLQREGDLSAHLSAGGGISAAITQGINALAIDVETVLQETRRGTHSVSSGASALCRSLAQANDAQAHLGESAAATSATLQEVTVAINETAQNSAEGAAAALENRRLAELAAGSADAALAQIETVNRQVLEAGENVEALGGRSREIGDMAVVIREIAEQTNLLALNAAIEAARAGEQGRGFAVVADEVRKLAERTAQATAQIERTIGTIQQDIGAAVQRMDVSRTSMSDGLARTVEVRESLAAITATACTAYERAQAIADSSKAQGGAAEDIARNVEDMAQAIQSQSSSLDEIERLAKEFEDTAFWLQTKLTHFKLH